MEAVTVSEVREHIAFLRAVHVASSRGASSLYVDGARLRAAAREYFAWLGSMAAGAAVGDTVLVTRAPPLDVAWCWHVHRLTPRDYARDCAALGANLAVRRKWSPGCRSRYEGEISKAPIRSGSESVWSPASHASRESRMKRPTPPVFCARKSTACSPPAKQ